MAIKDVFFFLVIVFYFSAANAWGWRSVYNPEPEHSDKKEKKFEWLIYEIRDKFEVTDGDLSGTVRIYQNSDFTIKIWIRDTTYKSSRGYGNDYNNDTGECSAVRIVNYIFNLLEQKNWTSWVSIQLDLNGKIRSVNNPLIASDYNELCGPNGLWSERK